MTKGAGELYEFGPFRLEPEERLLLRGGQPALLTPKAFELLVFLVRHQGRIVTKDQIMGAIWPGATVEEGNITVLVSSLRKALGESQTGDPYISTVPRVGYRFTAPIKIDTLPPVPAIPPRTRSFQLLMLGVLLAATLGSASIWWISRPHASNSLAVLPFKNLNRDPASDFLGYSLADAVISKLGRLRSITVRPSSAIERFKSREIDLKQAAAELRVDTLVTGNFIHDGNRLRITYQVVDVPASKILYTDALDLNYKELLAAHDEVSLQVVRGLNLKLSSADVERLKPDTPVKPLAYEYYLRGIDLLGSHNFPLAVQMLLKSTEVDPSFALAWSYLGQAYNSDASFELGGAEQYRRARDAYQRALALQPGQVEAQMFLANLFVDNGKVEDAVPLLREALNANPKNAAVLWELGYAYRFAGALEASLAACLNARQIDPLVKGNGALLNTYLYLGQYSAFVKSLPRPEQSPFFRFYRGFGEYHLQDLDHAAEDFVQAYRDEPTLYTGIGRAFAYAIEKQTSTGLKLLRDLETTIEERGVGDPEAAYKMAQAYAVLGDRPSAARMFHHAIDNGFFSYPYFEKDPLLDSIRADPAFSINMIAARKRYEAFQKRFF